MKLILFALAALSLDPVLAAAQTTTKNIDITVTHAGSCPCGASNAPNVCVNTPTVAANQPVSISWACGPNNANSYIALVNAPQTSSAGQALLQPYYSILGGAASGTTTLTAPNAKVDRDEPWYVALYQNYAASGGQVAISSPFTVTKSINPPAPTATLPASLAADPFVPQHTITVCLSGGCNFNDVGTAVASAFQQGWDNVKVIVSAGEYPIPPGTGIDPNQLPPHLWLYGISPDGGVTRAHLFSLTSGGQILGTPCITFPAGYSITVDNMEFGPWPGKMLTSCGSEDLTFRNDYIHTSLDGLETSNRIDFHLRIYNSVFARNGGGAGPDHNVYIGFGNFNNVADITNSVFEQSMTGHSYKSRALTNNITCSIFLNNMDNVYLSSQDQDFDGGNTTINKSLLINGNGGGGRWNNQNSWTHNKFAIDEESGGAVTMFNEIVTNSNLINDHDTTFWPMVLGARFTGPKPVPAIWSGNKVVWAYAVTRDLSGNGADPTGTITTGHTGNVADVTLDGTNSYYTSWPSAGLSVAPFQEPYGWRDVLSMMPAGCTDPIGLVKVPAS